MEVPTCYPLEQVSHRLYFRPYAVLIFINDIVVHINSTVRLFADDTSLYLIVGDPVEAARFFKCRSKAYKSVG